MDLNWAIALGGLIVGIVVGLTGMGGGALMTPMLMFFFDVNALTAVSSDLAAAFLMKPIGGGVHIKRRTVEWGVVRWLLIGSVPAAFAGVFVLRALGDSAEVQDTLKLFLGVALLLAAAGLAFRAYQNMRARARRAAGISDEDRTDQPLIVRPLPTMIVGALGGLIVGITSVGSGSLIIIALMALYPMMRASRLVGTDLVQAVPLVGSAALAHYFFGDFHLDLTLSLLLGSIPGVFIGAQFSSLAPEGLIRRALGIVLVASALKLLGTPNVWLLVAVVAMLVAGPVLWATVRQLNGLPRRGLWETVAGSYEAASDPASELKRG